MTDSDVDPKDDAFFRWQEWMAFRCHMLPTFAEARHELYTPESQKIFARNFYRPIRPDQVDKADLAAFPDVKLVKVGDVFGGWAKAQPAHFGDGGIFDPIYSQD